MKHHLVTSSNLLSVGYDAATAVLEIAFKTGTIYQYYGVPESLFIELLEADSKGKFFDRYIKKGGFMYKMIR